MDYPHNHTNSETQHDPLTQATLGYWSAPPRELAQPDPFAWEAGSPVPAGAGAWIVLAVIIMLALAVLL